MRSRVEEISIEEFDLSLSSMRIMNLDRVAVLEKSMKIDGQLQPVIGRVCDGGVQLIDGFKRLYAAEAILMDSLECRLFEVDETQARIMLLSYNRTNQSMEVWEEAMVLKDLLERDDLDQRRLAGLVGHSPSWVSRRLSLISKVDEGVAAEIRMGALTSRHARALMRLPRGNQVEVARVISGFHLSSRLSERLVDAWLEAEDADGQRQILAYPEHIIWHQRDPGEEPYDSRLSGYGNTLMQAVMHLWQPLEVMLSTLRDPLIGMLDEGEKEIAYPFLRELHEKSGKLSDALKALQIE